MTTLGTKLDQYDGVGPGFDILRVFLAVAILYSHSFNIAEGPGGILAASHIGVNVGAMPSDLGAPSASMWDSVRHLKILLTLNHTDTQFVGLLVPMFFALSGFLVTGSAFRTKSVVTFLTFRILRIAPALFVEVSLSALVLGPLLTVFSLSEYFSDPKFLDYFGNILGIVRFQLPGLFLSNPTPDIVNGNLRTLPAEFYCYLIIAAMIITGVLFHRLLFTLLFLLTTLFVLILGHRFGLVDSPMNSPMIVYYFFCGSLIYHWRNQIPYNLPMFLVLSFLLYLHCLGKSDALYFPLILTYITVYLGLSEIPTPGLVRKGDYSYGVYLYGFPLTQALVLIVPWFQGHGLRLFIATTPIVFGFAMFSWHMIERPTLRLKRLVGRAPIVKPA